jgi:hypothetical protein
MREKSTTRPRGQLACPALLPVVLEHPWLLKDISTRTPVSILCGCVNKSLYRQANAVWGRYPTACMYARGSKGVFVGLVTLGLFVHPSDQSAVCCLLKLLWQRRGGDGWVGEWLGGWGGVVSKEEVAVGRKGSGGAWGSTSRNAGLTGPAGSGKWPPPRQPRAARGKEPSTFSNPWGPLAAASTPGTGPNTLSRLSAVRPAPAGGEACVRIRGWGVPRSQQRRAGAQFCFRGSRATGWVGGGGSGGC